MKLQLIARHLRDDVDHVIAEVDHEANIGLLVDRMEDEIEDNRSEGSNWRYSIQPTDEAYS